MARKVGKLTSTAFELFFIGGGGRGGGMWGRGSSLRGPHCLKAQTGHSRGIIQNLTVDTYCGFRTKKCQLPSPIYNFLALPPLLKPSHFSTPFKDTCYRVSPISRYVLSHATPVSHRLHGKFWPQVKQVLASS
jgi:hypothetical protein